MSGEEHNFTVWGFIKGFGKFLIGALLLLQGLIGLVMMILIVGVVISVSNNLSGEKTSGGSSIQSGSAMLLNPAGVLVEESEVKDPFAEVMQQAYGVRDKTEVQVGDIIRVIRAAKTDDRIKGMVLDLSQLRISSSSASKMHDIADAIDDFKTSGKQVTAVGDNYGQEQYMLAAHADKILMHDYGNIVLYGYGSYGAYLKSLLEKLKINSHVFRVGTFKSAVEPFIRDDMSPAAKEANRAYISVMWNEYAHDVEKARHLSDGAIQHYADDLGGILSSAGGDMAKAALDYGLVDELKSRPEQLAYLKDMYGADKSGKSYKNVGFNRYLTSVESKEEGDGSAPNVAIVTAAGVIVDGETAPGDGAGGDTIAGYLKKALEDDNVKAVVLRVDSPGGSAFASEIIRDGVLALKKAGKPVVVSMGSLAASGGYWISSAADEIYASPTTITGSIGIFGYFSTFENTAAEIGVHVDGVGTTNLSPIMATGLGPLPDAAADLFQQSTEEGYERFLQVVGEGRGLDRDYVDSIGQGRVWIGETALKLKLVDKLGDLDDAVADAAERAGLKDYDVVDMIDRPTPFEKIFSGASAQLMTLAGFDPARAKASQGALSKFLESAEATADFMTSFNDPNGLYARCLACETK